MKWYVACIAIAAAVYLVHRAMVETIRTMRRLSRMLPDPGLQSKPATSELSVGLGMMIPEFEATEVVTGRTFGTASIVGKSVTLAFIRVSQLTELSRHVLGRFLDQCWLRSDDKVYVFLVDAVDDDVDDGATEVSRHLRLDELENRDDIVLARSREVSLSTELNVHQTPWALHVDKGGIVDQVGTLLQGEATSREPRANPNGRLG
ncbi:MAG: hypothetical protein OXG82_00725 [Gammaproteobacteria bacterium]|nr:hypothetical protein [Gammaproteobacteria bacterium]